MRGTVSPGSAAPWRAGGRSCRAGHNRTRAARLLGISRRTLYRRLERLRRGGSVDAAWPGSA